MQIKTPCLAILVAGGAGACVDARDSYDDFGGRLVDADTREVDGAIVTSLPDVTGEWYMVDELELGEPKRVHFRSTLTFRATGENTGELDWSGQPLDYQTLEPVGAPFVAEGVRVRNDATAEVPMVGELPALANPVSGSDAPVDAVIHLQLRSAEFLCGHLTGVAGALPVDGINSFGATRTTPDLPPPIVRCEDEPTP